MAIVALAIIAALSVAPLKAQPAAQTVQAALAKEAGTLSDKFTGLARVTAAKYDWKPGQEVRSTGDVLNLIVMENGMLARTLTGAAGGGRPAPITDPDKMQDALKTSYGNLQQDDYRTLGCRYEGAGQALWQGHDEGRCDPVSFRGPARAPRAVDRLCTLERHCPALVEIVRERRSGRSNTGSSRTARQGRLDCGYSMRCSAPDGSDHWAASS